MVCVKALVLALVALPTAFACSDSSSFSWKGEWGGTKYTYHCSFFNSPDSAKNEKRKNNWCNKTVDGDKIKSKCKKSCDNCSSGNGCTENTRWVDSKGNKCSFYSTENKCDKYADKYEKDNGSSAWTKCCVCKDMAIKNRDLDLKEVSPSVSEIESKKEKKQKRKEKREKKLKTFLRSTVQSCKDSTTFTWDYTHDGTKYTHHCSFLINGNEAKNEKRQNNWCPDKDVKKNCKKSCNNCDDGPSPPDDECKDTKVDWTDSKGKGCTWYGNLDSRCDEFGDKRWNDGKANSVCCVCGGGKPSFSMDAYDIVQA